MDENVVPLPVWKRGSTPHELFTELARLAARSPDRYRRVLIVVVDEQEGREVRYWHRGFDDAFELIGLADVAHGLIRRDNAPSA